MEMDRAPGTARFGNFINYYSFNPPERRLKLIPSHIFENIQPSEANIIHVLDVGCNAGDLTDALHQQITACLAAKTNTAESQCLTTQPIVVQILGIDLDAHLIQRCIESHSKGNNVIFKQIDVMSTSGRETLEDYMSSCKIHAFDIVTCFSLTMWIHLNHGDDGLMDFLTYVSGLCGQFLLIEPQPWKCYRNAERRMKKEGCKGFEWYKKLEWKSSIVDDIDHFLMNECQLELTGSFGKTEDWDRPLCLYSKKHFKDKTDDSVS